MMRENLLSLNNKEATFAIDVDDRDLCSKAAATLGLKVSFADSIGDGPPVNKGRLLMFVEMESQTDYNLLIEKVRELEVAN